MIDKTAILKEAADHFFSLAELFSALAESQPSGGSAHPPAADTDDLPPFPGEPQAQSREQVFAECPVHFTPWTVKEGGISKNGRVYKAFWKCNGKNPDGSYCDKKPDPSWVRAHDPEKALAA